MSDHNRDWLREESNKELEQWKRELAAANSVEVPRYLVLTILAIGLAILLFMALIARSHARWSPQLAQEWGDIPDHVREWFKSVRNPQGVPCCDIADGHRTPYDIRSDGYWVPIAGEWRQVPQEAIVYNAGNPVGEAVVWYVRQGESTYYIRCFVSGSQG